MDTRAAAKTIKNLAKQYSNEAINSSEALEFLDSLSFHALTVLANYKDAIVSEIAINYLNLLRREEERNS